MNESRGGVYKLVAYGKADKFLHQRYDYKQDGIRREPFDLTLTREQYEIMRPRTLIELTSYFGILTLTSPFIIIGHLLGFDEC